jgi:uncharacterized protein YecT (DUF1311 family)
MKGGKWKMKKLILVLWVMFLMLTLAVMPALSGEKQGVKADDPCDGSTAVELRICAEKKLKDADNRLNEVYQKLKSKIDTMFDYAHDVRLKEENKISKSLLIKAQRAWIEFRDAECELSGQLERYGATANWKQVSIVSCQVIMTQARSSALERYLAELNEK